MLAFGAFMLVCVRWNSTFRVVGNLALGVPSLLLGGWLTYLSLRPFRFHIGADGLTVRQSDPKIDRLLPWTEIDCLILDQPAPVLTGDKNPSAVLLLIPAIWSSLDLPLTHRSPLDDRPCLVLLELDEVRESPDVVAEAIARFAGNRFTDYRQVVRQRFASPDFAVGLRGYDRAVVDALVRKGQEGLVSTTMLPRLGAMAEIQQGREKLPVAARGYDRAQVDAFLDDLCAALARWEDDPKDAG
ncbi:DivIVA domain-containing protein [Micromonospora sp. NPDC049282]|uniref:DivIVA domain-containing protein n=1 Tax=Micromonospora sp. NPDC049282 TaxID=3364269 RepID=UPI00371FA6CD